VEGEKDRLTDKQTNRTDKILTPLPTSLTYVKKKGVRGNSGLNLIVSGSNSIIKKHFPFKVSRKECVTFNRIGLD